MPEITITLSDYQEEIINKYLEKYSSMSLKECLENIISEEVTVLEQNLED